MNPFDQAITDAFAAATAVAGKVVTYQRGTDWTKASAVSGQSLFDMVDAGGTAIQFQSRDYIFRTCDLFFGDTQVVPKRGDMVKEVVGDTTHVYEVLHPDANAQVWHYSDHGRGLIRIHTKLKVETPL